MRRPRLWFAPTDSGGPGFPSGPTTGLRLDGDRRRREIAEGCRVPGRTDQGSRRRGGAPEGVAVCCCLPAIREISRGLLTMRLSALRLPSFEGRQSKLRDDDACPTTTLPARPCRARCPTRSAPAPV